MGSQNQTSNHKEIFVVMHKRCYLFCIENTVIDIFHILKLAQNIANSFFFIKIIYNTICILEEEENISAMNCPLLVEIKKRYSLTEL